MQFSDTTNKNGVLQRIEHLTGLGDGGITGNTTRKAIVTAIVNDAFDELMPLVLSFTDKPRFDDPNNNDLPVGTINIVSGQSDYFVTEDDNSLDILNITNIRIFTSASATEYQPLERMTLDDSRALDAMAPNPSITGIPTDWLENNNVVFLYPEPNYAATDGIQLFFEREQSYFASTDTTKEPGIPKPFHGLLPLIAAHEWLIVNKPSNTSAITRLEAKIAERKQQLKDIISLRNPTKARLAVLEEDNH